MKPGFFKWVDKLIFSIVFAYVLVFLGFGSLYLYSLFLGALNFNIQKLFLWISVGLSVSLLASLCSWPFALSLATLIEHNRERRIVRHILKLLKYYSTLPLILFVYIYVEVIGDSGFLTIQNQWDQIFSSSNFVTQALAFAITLILYPLTILPFFDSKLTIDVFFKTSLESVIDFAQAGLVAFVVVLGLFIYILPKMVLYMERNLKNEKSLKSFEIIKSVGGTPWESIQMTVMQSMKNSFNSILIHFTRVCFFEGLITYSLLHFFMFDNNPHHEQWGASLSSIFISTSLDPNRVVHQLMALCGVLLITYFLFILVEIFLKKKEARSYASS